MRKKRKYKKNYQPDVQYQNIAVSRFINYLMERGKKSVAERLFYKAFDNIQKEIQQEPLTVFEKAIENASPLLEVVSKRVGGANYQVPREVRPERRFFLACHWIIDAARTRKGKPIAQKLAEEIIAASKNEGVAIKKKQNIHRMAEANRAFAHFAR
ncbi:30S ribosomal protein S7 [Candidatus Wolfebacteria bacterium CG1_02_39_135]|uniref:Small ribosomal subunit protein uS7 n=5 Tax=Candidatus Wolfeibacteriota TaxID=1752735 RepID=A0A2M7Q7P9_9BACT|nr:30S ribosomal protein S7 [Parcubacteria group bacterium]NCO89496.1 30S ribosomal protein S7 [Candidatus Wolfebacteria bacterium]OIO64885.1 MAG: 30S ribosomal protein S7 [Candidatus Wolfebacteria bacterium CG1_02_39_135]PIU98816.1 MAG: 30S ribosomal protein S7 [Candidatus Wolfebacteria bacterium CG03_land_8_20_14_0_80_39_317]PIY59142.1 MAG: 30S ribosomal protein S7 [Candidatus Wolfebacteria bacterium CG_4_10_14_0_8_um_filter_39_64]PJB84043.1 MAG: 30S ribosomal protein S7 [Candidatus Wolfebac